MKWYLPNAGTRWKLWGTPITHEHVREERECDREENRREKEIGREDERGTKREWLEREEKR